MEQNKRFRGAQEARTARFCLLVFQPPPRPIYLSRNMLFKSLVASYHRRSRIGHEKDHIVREYGGSKEILKGLTEIRLP